MVDWTRSGDWNTETITRTPKGYLVERDVRITGELTGLRALVYYSERFPRELDLDALTGRMRPDETYGDILIDVARFREAFGDERVRLLRAPCRCW